MVIITRWAGITCCWDRVWRRSSDVVLYEFLHLSTEWGRTKGVHRDVTEMVCWHIHLPQTLRADSPSTKFALCAPLPK